MMNQHNKSIPVSTGHPSASVRRFSHIGLTIASLFAMLTMLTGCWDRTEINDLGLVLATAIDYADDQYQVSIQIPLPSQMEGSKGGENQSFYIETEYADSISEAIAALQKRIPRRLFFAHRRTIIVSEHIAKKGIREIYDSLSRSPESRLTAYMVVAKGRAFELLQASPRIERFSSDAIRELNKMNGNDDVNMKHIAQALNSTGLDPFLIYMGPKQLGDDKEKNKENNQEIEVLGYAQFRDDKMVHVLNNDEMLGLGWMVGKRRASTFAVQDDDAKPTFQILAIQSKLSVTLDKHDRPSFKLKVRTKLKLNENNSSKNYTNTAEMDHISQLASETMNVQVQQTVKAIRANQSDIAGLGLYISRVHPKLWEDKLQSEWETILANLQVNVDAQAVISQTGLTTGSIAEKVKP